MKATTALYDGHNNYDSHDGYNSNVVGYGINDNQPGRPQR